MSSLAELKAEIGAVWCPKCREEALPHDPKGTCMFCDTLLVGKAGEALWQNPERPLGEGEPRAGDVELVAPSPASAKDARSDAAVTASSPSPSGRRKGGSKWTPETIVQAMRDFAAEHGKPPRRSDLGGASFAAFNQKLDWGALMEQAGLERPRKGIPAAPLGAGPKAGPRTSQAPSEQPRPGPAPSGEKRSRTAKPVAPPPLTLAELAAQLEHARAEMERARDVYYDAVFAFSEHALVQTIKNEQGL